MEIKSQNQFYLIAGLSLGLIGTLIGIHSSSVIESSPALIGIVSAVWCAVSASIIGGRIKNR